MICELYAKGNNFTSADHSVYFGSFTKFGSPCVYECVAQYGSRAVGLGELKGFSRIFSDVGIEPKLSEGIFEELCCESSVGVYGNVLLEFSE